MSGRARSWMVLFAVSGLCTLGLFVCTAEAQRAPASRTTVSTADDLFDQSTVRDIQLTMKADDWATLRATYLEDTYYRADMAWNGQVVPIVGVRSRGSGSRNPAKPGLKIAFAEYLDQKFLGLKSIVLVNAYQDPSMLRQRIAMQMFARMGVPAPRVAHVRLFVNREYVGLYMVFEPIDKNFLARVFGEKDGYLYDYRSRDGYQWDYLGSDLQIYADLFDPQTHEMDAPSLLYGPLDDFFRTFNEVRDDDFRSAASELLDLEAFVRYLAIDNFMAERDGFLGDWGANNFYLYRFQDRKVMQLVPWDKDLSLSGADFDIFHGAEANVLARRVLNIPELRRLYLETELACAMSAMAPASEDSPTAWLEAELQREVAQIHEPALADTHKPFTNEEFEDELVKVQAFARDRAAFVIREAQKALAQSRQFK